ncbi:MAG: hypothetical protein LUQ45_03375 [Methanoregulaceae archaeon]|nr:hypothetical protein [Methanoregulaceae archaeon]
MMVREKDPLIRRGMRGTTHLIMMCTAAPEGRPGGGSMTPTYLRRD